MVKNLPAVQETWVRSLGWEWEDYLEKEMAADSSILAGEFHGQRSLVGYSPWGPRESDTTQRLNTVHCVTPIWSVSIHLRHLSPSVAINLFSVSVNFCFVNKFICIIF